MAKKIEGREQDDDDEVIGVVARECGDPEDAGRDNEMSVGAGIENVDKGSGDRDGNGHEGDGGGDEDVKKVREGAAGDSQDVHYEQGAGEVHGGREEGAGA